MSLFGSLLSGGASSLLTGGGSGLFSALSGLLGGGSEDIRGFSQGGNSSSVEQSETDSYATNFNTQDTGPGQFTAGLFNDVYLPSLVSAFQSVGTDPYSGPLVAGADPLQVQANTAGEQLAFDSVGQGAGVRGLAEQLISGETLDPSRAPGFQGVLSSAIQPLLDQFSEVIVPQITSSAINSGAYGGSRNGIALSSAADDLQENILDTSSQLAYTNYNAERERQLNAGSLLGQAFTLDSTPIDYANNLGAQRREFANDEITENYQLDQLARTQPFEAVGQFGAGLGLVGDRSSVGEGEQASNQTQFTEALRQFFQIQDKGTVGNATDALTLGTAQTRLNDFDPTLLSQISNNANTLLNLGNSY